MDRARICFSRWLLYSLMLLLGACSMTKQVSNDVQVDRAVEEVAEQHLMDVWIALFDAGELPDDEEDAQGLSLEIRQAEARYMPVQLRDTLEKTGYWRHSESPNIFFLGLHGCANLPHILLRFLGVENELLALSFQI